MWLQVNTTIIIFRFNLTFIQIYFPLLLRCLFLFSRPDKEDQNKHEENVEINKLSHPNKIVNIFFNSGALPIVKASTVYDTFEITISSQMIHAK